MYIIFKHLSDLDSSKQLLNRLIFLSDENLTSKEKISENIEKLAYVTNNINSKKDFLSQFETTLTEMITNFIACMNKELEQGNIEAEKKSKNFQSIKRKSEIYLRLGEYKLSYQLFSVLTDISKQVNDNLLYGFSKEGIAISLILDELSQFDTDSKINLISEQVFRFPDMKSSGEIEGSFDSALQIYKKSKLSENLVNTYFLVASYYILIKNKNNQFMCSLKRIYDEIENLQPDYKIFYLLKLKSAYESIKMKRKAIFFLYMAMGICLENFEFMNLLPYVFKEVCETFQVNDIFHHKIENPAQFHEVQKMIRKNNWKKIKFNSLSHLVEDKKEMKEFSKKRIDKENKLYVTKRIDTVKKFLLDPRWDPIQFNIYLNLMIFYKNYNKKL